MAPVIVVIDWNCLTQRQSARLAAFFLFLALTTSFQRLCMCLRVRLPDGYPFRGFGVRSAAREQDAGEDRSHMGETIRCSCQLTDRLITPPVPLLSRGPDTYGIRQNHASLA